MRLSSERQRANSRRCARRPFWKVITANVFGAARRLHRYRDAQDQMLARIFIEQEARAREALCCLDARLPGSLRDE